jgi:hypothetical protein
VSGDDLRTMFESKYIGAWSLQGRDVTVTIARIVAAEIVGEGGMKSKKPLVYFVGKEKPLILNKTMLKSLFDLHATFSARDLVGKRVTLYATKCQGARGGEVDCVRIRPTIPRSKTDSADDLSAPVDQAMRAAQVAQVRDGNDDADHPDNP